MIASLVTEDVYRSLKEHRRPDPSDYARWLNELPGDWPPPETARRRGGSAAVNRAARWRWQAV